MKVDGVLGSIGVDVIDKWLNLIQGYFYVHYSSSQEIITFSLPKATPHIKD